MSKKSTPGRLFEEKFTKSHLRAVFDEFIADGSAVGRDGLTVSQFSERVDDEIDVILRKVRNCTYQFTPYKEKLISKGALKVPRQISIPTIRDKLVLKFLSEYLAEVYPGHVSRVPHSTIKSVHEASAASPSTHHYLRLDIENFFPSIDHKILMRIIRRRVRKKQVLHLIQSALSTPTGKRKSSHSEVTRGVPQGLSISNILSSLYLSDVDEVLSHQPEVKYFRFVDDILMIGPASKIDALATSTPRLLKSVRKITCHKVGDGSKSMIVPIPDGIDYLGYRFCVNKIEVRDASFKKMFLNIMKVISGMKYAGNKGPLIWKLNLRISGCQFMGRRVGWLFFFSQSDNKQQLKQLDAFVTSQARRVLEPGDLARVKRFVKAYHEIRFNADATAYFPNFDNFDDEQKKQQIAVLIPKLSREKIDALTPKELEQLFRKSISREIADLEKDMMEVFS